MMDALLRQVGGTHYKDVKIQPIEFTLANNLGFCEGSIVKYTLRAGNKNGLSGAAEDMGKVEHYFDFLIQHWRSRPVRLWLRRLLPVGMSASHFARENELSQECSSVVKIAARYSSLRELHDGKFLASIIKGNFDALLTEGGEA